MKPAAFEYTRASSLDEVLSIVAANSEAKIIAGGQSLVPMLNLRLAQPAHLIDINQLRGLDHIESSAEGLRIGALVRHTSLAENETAFTHAPLLVQAVRHVGHVAIRNRGTLGGSLVHADPVAELPAAVVALEGLVRLRSRDGAREVLADEFFESSYTTGIHENEVLVEVVIPTRPAGEGTEFLELTMREGDFAIVAAAAVTRVEGGRLVGSRIVWSGAGFRPLLANDLNQRLAGVSLMGTDVERLCAEAVEFVDPPADIHGSAGYRRHALGVLSARALRVAAQRAQGAS